MTKKGNEGSLLLFIVLAVGIVGMYSMYGVLQEGLYVVQEDGSKFSYVSTLLAVQLFVSFVLASAVEIALAWQFPTDKASEDPTRKTLMSAEGVQQIAPIAAVYMLAMWFSNESIKYVSYPVQTLGKSCKMIPVMIGQVVFDGRRHPMYKYVCVLAMAAGVAAFNLMRMKKKSAPPGADSSGEHDDAAMDPVMQEAIGMALLLGSLLCDMYTGPNQDRVLKEYAGSNRQLMAIQNLAGVAVAIAMMAITGELVEGPAYLASHPLVLQAVLVFSVASALGQLFVFAMLYYFDSLLLTTVTTIRKFLSIVVSDIRFKHNLKAEQWASVVLVFAAIAYDKIGAKFVPQPWGAKKAGAALADAKEETAKSAGSSGESEAADQNGAEEHTSKSSLRQRKGKRPASRQ